MPLTFIGIPTKKEYIKTIVPYYMACLHYTKRQAKRIARRNWNKL